MITLLAQGIDASETGLYQTAVSAGFDASDDLPNIIGDLLEIGLGFVGFIFFIYVLYGGFLWMTAQGSEEKVEKAIGIIKNGVIGVIIITSAYAISMGVVNLITKGSL